MVTGTWLNNILLCTICTVMNTTAVHNITSLGQDYDITW
jgi:hypothetical protein